jgi:hypothetical protein
VGAGRGWRGPEEEPEARSFFYIEVEADADGNEVAGGHLLAHVVDGLDDVGEGEGAGHDAGGEQAEEGRVDWQGPGKEGGIRAREPGVHRAEVAQDPLASLTSFGVPNGLHELTILPPPNRDGAFVSHQGNYS